MRFSGQLGITLLPLLFGSVLAKQPSGYQTSACNGSPDLCGRQYDEVTHLGAHNSAFVRDATTDYALAANQYFDAPTLLDAGIRLLQAQVQEVNKGDGKPQLCHSSCGLFDAGPLVPWLTKVKKWMDDHPSEVVTILIVNGPTLPSTTYKSALDSAGLSDLLYVPQSATATSDWPTLREMIDSKKRLVFFLSTGANISPVPGILDEFTYIFETPFTVTQPTGFNCTVDRPKGLPDITGRIPFMNHFLYDDVGAFGILLPNDTYITTTNGNNGTGNLMDATQRCANEWRRPPGFILVDFADQGPAINVADEMNGMKSAVNRVKAPAPATSKNSGYNGPTGLPGLQKLAMAVENGANVTSGQWIITAGSWIGTVGAGAFDLGLSGLGNGNGDSSSSTN